MANYYPSMDKSFQYVLFALMAVRTATVLTAVSKSHNVITCDLLFDQTGNDMIADCKRQSLLACND